MWPSKQRPRVRVHIDGDSPSVEGVLVAIRGGHYVITDPRVVESPDRAFDLESPEVRVPSPRVLFYEVLR